MDRESNEADSGAVSPLTVWFMFACYYSKDPVAEVGATVWASFVGHDVRRWLFDNGLVDCRWQATDKGIAWVSKICATPLPIQKWV